MTSPVRTIDITKVQKTILLFIIFYSTWAVSIGPIFVRNLRVSCRALSPQVTEPIFTSVATCLAISFEGIAATVGCGGDSSLMANANSELSPNDAREKNTLSHKICHFLRRETGLSHSS